MASRHPFQCLQASHVPGQKDQRVLYAAAGDSIYSFDIRHGTVLSVWPPEVEKLQQNDVPISEDADGEPPGIAPQEDRFDRSRDGACSRRSGFLKRGVSE